MALDPTLSVSNMRGSVRKHIYEKIGKYHVLGYQYEIVTETEQADFDALQRTTGQWFVLEFGTSRIKPKMPVMITLTACARGNDSPYQIEAMIDAVRDVMAPGTIFPLYRFDTQAIISGFMVDDVMEGPTVPQPGGGFNCVITIMMRVGVVA